MITCHFVTVGTRRVHYTRAGAGPVVALLHASPCSSKVLRLPQSIFAERFTALAFDTPGFGLSDPLPIAQPSTEDFADALAETLDALGIEQAAVHGRHTGAQIAVEFGARHPTRCAMVLTDGFPIFDANVREAREKHYLLPIQPSWDGGHLLWMWFRYREQHVFWPWNAPDAAHRADTDVPALDELHRGTIEFMEAGDAYRVGYATAYRHRGIAALDDLRVPACFGWRPGDSLYFMRDRLPSWAWSAEFPRDPIEAARAERDVFARHPAEGDAPPPPRCTPIAGRTTTDYLRIGARQCLVRSIGDLATGEPVVALHPLPGSSFLLDDLLVHLGRERPAVAFDLPGHGESEPLAGNAQSIEALADAALATLDTLGIARATLYAKHTAAALALEIARRAPSRVTRLVLDAPFCLSIDARGAHAARWLDGVAPFTPEWTGGHLVRAWHMRRDLALWWPWFMRDAAHTRRTPLAIDPAALTVELREAMKQPASFEPVWRAVLDYPLVERLRECKAPVTMGAREDDVYAICLPAARMARPDARIVADPTRF